MFTKLREKKAFTLVEIMIVVAIIGLLIAIALPNFVRARNTARTGLCENNLRLIGHALEQWRIETNAAGDALPGAIADLGVYIKGDVLPTCPSAGAYAFGAGADDIDCDVHGTYNVATGVFTPA